MSYEIGLIDLLKTRDEELHGRLLHMRKTIEPLLSYTQGKFPYYTPHDFFHSESVQENLDWIIPDKIKEGLNNFEIFFLIVSAWLHDWGMIGTPEELPETIRKTHHIRTQLFFEQQHARIGLSEHEAIIAGKISKGHRKIDLYSNEYNDMIIGSGIRIRIRFLAAALRIADETDITHSRTPEIIYYTLNPTGDSETEFRKHLSICGIGQLDEKHKIYITAIARDPLGAESIRRLVGKIQTELNAVKSIISSNGIEIDTIELRLETRGFIDKPIGFEISKDKIVDLLIGKRLYKSADVAIRELIQNAVDSCNLRMLIDEEYQPKIEIEKNDNMISITDNGIGMNYFDAKHFLSNVGETFYSADNSQYNAKKYEPISKFGIGFLSTFLIASQITIETKKKEEESCLFTINKIGKQWKYEKGNMIQSGTVIRLMLNEEGSKINLENTIYNYFININIPLWYNTPDNGKRQFISSELNLEIAYRFLRSYRYKSLIEKIMLIELPEVEVLLVAKKMDICFMRI